MSFFFDYLSFIDFFWILFYLKKIIPKFQNNLNKFYYKYKWVQNQAKRR